MFKWRGWSGAMILLQLCCAGCEQVAQQPASYDYPNVPPIWIVEDAPGTTIFERKDLDRDRKVGNILVIPVYRNYANEGLIDSLAIAHPFVYQPGEDIEEQLSSLGQRENLRRLVFWAPGYFPGGMGPTFPWVPIINGKRMVVLELPKCIGSEESKITSAMKSLLLNGDFAVGKTVFLKPPPPPYAPAKVSEESYDIPRLVRATVYAGRYYWGKSAMNTHALWAFASGAKIVNRLSDQEKKTVATFVADTENAKEISGGNDKGGRGGAL